MMTTSKKNVKFIGKNTIKICQENHMKLKCQGNCDSYWTSLLKQMQ